MEKIYSVTETNDPNLKGKGHIHFFNPNILGILLKNELDNQSLELDVQIKNILSK